MRTISSVAYAALSLSLFACSSSSDSPTAQGSPQGTESFVPSGKEDNFISAKAQEYMVEGTTTVTIESELATASDDVKLARVHELISLKQIAIGWFLNEYLIDKHDAPNENYGGFGALTKNGSYEELDIHPLDDTTYEFTLRQELGGKLDLLNALPTRADDRGRRVFDLTIGRVSNEELEQLEPNAEWYRRAPWDTFNPETTDPSRLDVLTLVIWPEDQSADAYFDYNRLFEDGRLTAAVHFGWDYHANYHLSHSRSVYDWLISSGFQSPSASYDSYTRTSGPLTKQIQANGKPVTLEVSLFWGQPGTDTDPDTDEGGRNLEADMRDSFKNREVIMYSGHSGPLYGFALANWRTTAEGDLDDSEVLTLDMPSDLYQVVFAEGCDTYGLGQAFRMNPNKLGAKNIDVMTTTSFSNAGTPQTVVDSLNAIFGYSYSGNHRPVTMLNYTRDVDNNTESFNTMYGVHGIDDNPHQHPFAKVGKLCSTCAFDDECGGIGNACTALSPSERICTFECTDHDGCPEGYRCISTAIGQNMSTKRCAPISMTCTAPGDSPAPSLILNEVLAFPRADTNGDGMLYPGEDEFVEVVNASNAALDISGWTLADSVYTRFSFPDGTTVAPGTAVVVFAGGESNMFSGLGNTPGMVCDWQLGLDDYGDTVYLRDPNGFIVDQMSYGPEAQDGFSFVRATDGDPKAAWVRHGQVPSSPGKKRDGSLFQP